MTQRLPLDFAASPAGGTTHLRITLLIEGVLSFAANLLFIGIFFYTTQVFHWTLVQNFLLAAAQGAVYVLASLASQKVAKRVGDRRVVVFCNVAGCGGWPSGGRGDTVC